MTCVACGSENPAGKRFCGDCGAPLGGACPSCGAENPPDKRFCGDCGAALGSPALGQALPSGEELKAQILEALDERLKDQNYIEIETAQKVMPAARPAAMPAGASSSTRQSAAATPRRSAPSR